MVWFRKEKQPIESPKEKRIQTEGLWVKCDDCKQILWKKDLESSLLCCPKCNHHFKMGSRARLEMLFDEGRYDGTRCRAGQHGPAAIQGQQELQRPAEASGKKHGTERRPHHRRRPTGRQAGHHLRHGISVHRREHGRGGGREGDESHRPLHRRRNCLWWWFPVPGARA